jgi:hypothetical protein
MMCPSGVTCLPADCCFSELGLLVELVSVLLIPINLPVTVDFEHI